MMENHVMLLPSSQRKGGGDALVAPPACSVYILNCLLCGNPMRSQAQ